MTFPQQCCLGAANSMEPCRAGNPTHPPHNLWTGRPGHVVGGLIMSPNVSDRLSLILCLLVSPCTPSPSPCRSCSRDQTVSACTTQLRRPVRHLLAACHPTQPALQSSKRPRPSLRHRADPLPQSHDGPTEARNAATRQRASSIEEGRSSGPCRLKGQCWSMPVCAQLSICVLANLLSILVAACYHDGYKNPSVLT